MKPLLTAFLLASSLFAAEPSAAIRRVLSDQQAAWNRADIEGFMQGYSNSPDTTFIGKTMTKGFAGVLANYRKNYATAEKMGKLEFTEIEVKLLGKKYAMVTGRFHLDRTQAGGGESKGIFSLLLESEPTGWKVILDHTS